MTRNIAKYNFEKLRAELQQLFEDAGYVNEEISQFFEEAIQLHKKNAASRPRMMDTMSSKLRDALRE